MFCASVSGRDGWALPYDPAVCPVVVVMCNGPLIATGEARVALSRWFQKGLNACGPSFDGACERFPFAPFRQNHHSRGHHNTVVLRHLVG